MNWLRIEAGRYRSMSSDGYTITKEGVGLFQRGWGPSWKLREASGRLLSEHDSLRAAKARVERFRQPRLELENLITIDMVTSYLTSMHEAGHIIVERLTGNRRIRYATCVPDHGYDGCVCFAGLPYESMDRKTAKGAIMTGLAGDLAESLGQERSFDWRALSSSDQKPLLVLGPQLCDGEDFDLFVSVLADETLTLLRNNFEPLESMRAALRRRGRLSGRQIEALLRRSNLQCLPSLR
jgi:hypothetical protein